MNPAILLVALALGRSPAIVAPIYNSTPANPALACATVEWESRFKWSACHINADGSRDWRYWQINDRWHNPYAWDVKKHIEAGGKIMANCLKLAHDNPETALLYWNGSRSYPAHVLPIYYKLKAVLATLEMAQPNGDTPQVRLASYENGDGKNSSLSLIEQIQLYDDRRYRQQMREVKC
jgi:hypothetical protein